MSSRKEMNKEIRIILKGRSLQQHYTCGPRWGGRQRKSHARRRGGGTGAGWDRDRERCGRKRDRERGPGRRRRGPRAAPGGGRCRRRLTRLFSRPPPPPGGMSGLDVSVRAHPAAPRHPRGSRGSARGSAAPVFCSWRSKRGETAINNWVTFKNVDSFQ